MSDALSANAARMPALSKIETTPFVEPTTAEFLAKQSKDPLYRQLASTLGTLGYDYSLRRNGFLICVTPIDIVIQKIVQQSLQAHLLHAYHYPPSTGLPTE